MPYQMIAERDNEKAQSRSVSLFIAVAKARVWASEGWQVIVADDTGKTFTPDEFDELCYPDIFKPRAAVVETTALAGSGEPESNGGDGPVTALTKVVEDAEAASTAPVL